MSSINPVSCKCVQYQPKIMQMCFNKASVFINVQPAEVVGILCLSSYTCVTKLQYLDRIKRVADWKIFDY